jgi:hypothetical protein
MERGSVPAHVGSRQQQWLCISKRPLHGTTGDQITQRQSRACPGRRAHARPTRPEVEGGERGDNFLNTGQPGCLLLAS